MDPISIGIITNFSEDAQKCFQAHSDEEKAKIIENIFQEVHRQSGENEVEKQNGLWTLSSGAADRLSSLTSEMLISCSDHALPVPEDNLFAPVMRLITGDSNWQNGLNISGVDLGKMLYSVMVERDADISQTTLQWVKERLERAAVEISNPKLREIYYHNLLAYYPFFGPSAGDEIRIPNGPNGELVTYETERIELTPNALSSPLVAYGLIPKDGNKEAPPMLLLKGSTYASDEGCYLSLLSDINPFFPVGGYAFHLFAKERIGKWFEKNNREGFGKAVVLGASLGGALTLQAASYFPDQIKTAHAFNSPAMTSAVVDAWATKTQDLDEAEKPKINVYLQAGDPISSFVGSCWAADWNIFHVYAPVNTAFQSHAAAFTSHPKVYVIPGSAVVENNKLGRRLWSFVQNGLSIPFFIFAMALFPLFFIVHHVVRLAKKIFCNKQEPVKKLIV